MAKNPERYPKKKMSREERVAQREAKRAGAPAPSIEPPSTTMSPSSEPRPPVLETPAELKEIFREVPPALSEKYATLKTDREKQSFIKNTKISQQAQAERENEKRGGGRRPATTPEPFVGPPSPDNLPEPAPPVPQGQTPGTPEPRISRVFAGHEILKTRIRKSKKGGTLKRTTDVEGALRKAVWGDEQQVLEEDGGDAIPPEAKGLEEEKQFVDEDLGSNIPPEAKRFETEEQEFIDKNIAARHAADSGELFETLEKGRSRPERTPAEERSYLRELIEKAKQKFEWWKSADAKLIERSKELDAELEKMSGTEKGFRWIGEQYNKLDWKSKLALGVALGVGAGVSSAVMAPTALALCTTGIVAQRIAGLSTMYLKFEGGKPYQEKAAKLFGKEFNSKEVAMAKAMGYTAVMGAAMWGLAYGTKETYQWLMDKLERPIDLSAPKVSTLSIEDAERGADGRAMEAAAEAARQAEKIGIETAQMPPMPEGLQATATPEALAPVYAPEVPLAVIPATPGHGYEYMLKQMWGELQTQNLNPENYPEGSDIRRLIETAPKDIDTIVHKIAGDPTHGFFKLDGTSVRIDLGSHMTIGNDGQVVLVTPGNETFIQAPEGSPVTPPYPPEAIETRPPPPEVREMINNAAASPESSMLEPRPEPPPPAPPSSDVHVSDTLATAPETTAPALETVTNSLGVSIATGEPHIYAGEDAAHTYAYGGSPTEQADKIAGYLKTHPKAVVFGPDETGAYRVPWHLAEGKVIHGPAMRTDGFLSLFSTSLKPPGPEDLRSIIT